ncbi:hypothetical protein R1N_29130 [Enterobacter asburiae]|jgi:hypothetical protein|nr:hypothetical protein EAA2563_27900 [Enterobacter asburiae]BCP70726.1 hypothetical protein R1N_29130 [Enterobacter asburiae]
MTKEKTPKPNNPCPYGTLEKNIMKHIDKASKRHMVEIFLICCDIASIRIALIYNSPIIIPTTNSNIIGEVKTLIYPKSVLCSSKPAETEPLMLNSPRE